MKKESLNSTFKTDLQKCNWKIDTPVDVVCYSNGLKILDPKQSFTWNGMYNLVKFDSVLINSYAADKVLVKIDIYIDGFRIAKLRPEIEISLNRTEGLFTTEIASPKSAFASYARSDRPEVLPRLRSLEIHTNMDIFLDCLSIKPGEKWKNKIEREIKERDTFLLFWSKAAKKSKWVTWEWHKALREKGINFIEPHPLALNNECPLPEELNELEGAGMVEEIIRYDEMGIGNFGNWKGLWYWAKRFVYGEV